MRLSRLLPLMASVVIVVSLTGTVTLAQPGASASVPRLVSFAGAAFDATGRPRNGTVRITFAIYPDADAGTALWQETQRVAVSGGNYQALLGAGSPHGLPADLFTSGEARWLGIRIENEPEQGPRIMLLSVPYALKAQDSDRLGGHDVTAFVLSSSVESAAAEGDGPGGGSGNSAPKAAQSFTATASPGFISIASTGAPLSVNSSTMVAGLNTDLLDGMHAEDLEAHAQTLVDDEAGRRAAADEDEKAARLDGDAVLQNGLEAETLGRQAADESEATVRGNRDNDLQAAIDAERAERMAEVAAEKADKEVLKQKVDLHKQQFDEKSLALDQKIDGKSTELHEKTDAIDQKYLQKTDALDQKIVQEKTLLKTELEGKILMEKQLVKGELETRIALEKATLEQIILQEKGFVKGDLENQLFEKEQILKGDYDSKINQKELFLKGDYEQKILEKEVFLKSDYELKIAEKEAFLKGDYGGKIGLVDQKYFEKTQLLEEKILAEKTAVKGEFDQKLFEKEQFLKSDYDAKIALEKQQRMEAIDAVKADNYAVIWKVADDANVKILETKTKIDDHKASGDHDGRYLKKNKAVAEHKTDAAIQDFVIVTLQVTVAPGDEGRTLIMAVVGGTSTNNPDVSIVFGLFVDDAVVDNTIVRYNSTSDVRQVTLSRMLDLSAGMHTISVRWQPNEVVDKEPVLSVGAGGSSQQILVLAQ